MDIEKNIDISSKPHFHVFDSNELYILPEEFLNNSSSTENIYIDSTSTIIKFFRINKAEIKTFDKPKFYRQRRNNELFLPPLFIGYTLLSENSTILSVGLNILSNYIYDFFKGKISEKNNVNCEIFIETSPKKSVTKITFSGDEESFQKLTQLIKEMK